MTKCAASSETLMILIHLLGFCCPVGFICKQDCVPASDGEIPASFACPASYFGCPSTLGGGCCPDGMACGSATCYDTHPQTFTVSGPATTTNSRGDKITTTTTETTIITPGPETSTAAAASLIGVPKLIPSTVSKMPAIETGNSSSGDGGLTQAQIGGIVGGAIGLLAIIIIVAAVIMWQLKQTERYAREAESRRETSSGQPRSQKSGFGQPSISEVDGTDVDSIVRARATHNRTRSDSTTAGSRTPDLWGSNASTTPPTWVGWSTRPLASNASDGRQSSMDSYGAHHDNAAYPPRPSVESQGSRKPAHTRQWSDASELDGSAISAHGVSELDALDASDAARRRSNSSTRPPMAQMRRTSDPSGKARAEGGAVAATPLGPLAEVNELHGYYGAPDLAVGQTAARLNHKNSSLSSLPRDEKK